MDEKPAETGASPGALIGWGMTLLAVGALIVVSALSRRAEGDPAGFSVVGGIVLLVGWGLLTGGLVTMARRVDALTRLIEVAPSATEASPPR